MNDSDRVIETAKLKTWQQVVSSAAGGLVVAVSMTPLDVVKVRMQASASSTRCKDAPCLVKLSSILRPDQSRLRLSLAPNVDLHCLGDVCNCHTYRHHPSYALQYKQLANEAAPYRSMLSAFVKIGRTEGVTALWSGLTPAAAMILPSSVIYFTAFEYIKSELNERCQAAHPCDDNSPSYVVPLIAGGVARIWAVTVTSPMELCRTYMQAQNVGLHELSKKISSVVSRDGWRVMFRGYWPTIMRDVPFSAIYWPVYESCRYRLRNYYERRVDEVQAPVDVKFITSFISGAVGGSIANVVTMPFDVVKTKRQASIMRQSGDDMHFASTGTIMRSIVQTDGVRGLFAGIMPRLAKVAPACAIMISTYDWCKRHFAAHNEAVV